MNTNTREDTERELGRVVDRLMTMPLNRLEGAASDVQACADELVRVGRSLGVPIPDDATAPRLQPYGLGPVIAVLGRDCLDAAAEPHALQPVLDCLVALRRALP